jgi:4-amino-4-deoxy-L-arabinose transferase-like glycosyltransferase
MPVLGRVGSRPVALSDDGGMADDPQTNAGVGLPMSIPAPARELGVPRLVVPMLAVPRLVVAAAGVVVVVLLAFAGQYGFHRDEVYFIVAGQHPAWGYVDQPPLTPVLSALGVAIFGTTPAAARVLPAIVMGLLVLLTAALAGVLGGDRRAQAVAGLTVAVSGILLAGHLAATATYDMLAWVLIAWLIARLLAGGDPRLWLAVGVVAGIGLLNKSTLPLLPATLAAGLLLERRLAIVRSPWPWLGIAIALAIGAPNLAWQVANGLPQLEMARQLAANGGAENRANLIVLQILLAGPLLFPIAALGLGRLLLSPAVRTWRAFGWAYLLALAVTYWQSGKSYYVAGFLPVLIAAGAPPLAAWMSRGAARLRRGAYGVVWAASATLVAVLALPVLPPPALETTGINEINGEQGEQVGWPELVGAVERAAGTLTPEERDHAAIIASNYGEAGALELLGRDLPPVYSGHNSYWDFGRPSDDVTVVLFVGEADPIGLGVCRVAGTVDNGMDLHNDEQGAPIRVCRGRTRAWSELWPAFRHLG